MLAQAHRSSTRPSTRRGAWLLGTTLLMACGGHPKAPPPPAPVQNQKAEAEPVFVEGTGDYPLRSNPCRCLAERALSLEVRTPAGWERVALDNPDEETDLIGPLLQGFAEAPSATVEVHAKLTNEVRPYGDRHAARVLRLLDLSPRGD